MAAFAPLAEANFTSPYPRPSTTSARATSPACVQSGVRKG